MDLVNVRPARLRGACPAIRSIPTQTLENVRDAPTTLPLLATSLLVGAPLAAETLERQPCVFNFNDAPWFLLRTSAGALIPAPG